MCSFYNGWVYVLYALPQTLKLSTTLHWRITYISCYFAVKFRIMKIEIHLLSQSKAIMHENVKNAYTKDGMYCIYKEDGFVDKYPMVNIFRVRESY